MIASLAEGTSRITNYSNSADCAATLSCLEQLGVRIERGDSRIAIGGVGLHGFKQPMTSLDCGNSGTTMRLLAGILAGQDFTSNLTGDESLRSRPMQRIIEPLQMMGAEISSDKGRAPLTIHGTQSLQAIDYELLVASAQVKSSILLAGLNANGITKVIEHEPTRDHTERVLTFFGATVQTGDAQDARENGHFAAVRGLPRPSARDIAIPGDVSSAAYFIAAAALLAGSSVEICQVSLNPTRLEFLRQLQSLGFAIEMSDETIEANEPRGTVRAHSIERAAVSKPKAQWMLRGSLIPSLIDELPLMAVIGTQIEGGIEIRQAAELRVKESDRVASTAGNLRAMGAIVEEFEDGLRVGGSARLHGAVINPHGDHRIAMAFAIAGLIADGETEIKDSDCVAVSFPEFFELFESVVQY